LYLVKIHIGTKNDFRKKLVALEMRGIPKNISSIKETLSREKYISFENATLSFLYIPLSNDFITFINKNVGRPPFRMFRPNMISTA
jgi:hypothetical protein